MNPILKIIILNVFWYGAVYFGPMSKGIELFIFALGIAIALANFFISKPKMLFKNYFFILIGFFVYGLIQDHLLGIFGLIQYNQPYPPLWLLSMYGAFLCYYDDLFLKFRKMSLVLQVIFGAIGGPLAYVGGAAIAGLSIPDQMKTYYILFVGISWAIFFPLSLKVYQRLENS